MKSASIQALPAEYSCNACGLLKVRGAMVVVFLRREKVYYLRPCCKDCHNKRERGHRREWKKKYLQKWRRKNAKLNESYWRNDQTKERCRVYAGKRFNEKHDAILIQGRMRRRGFNISIAEAEGLLKKFGRCYPTRFGLTPKGLKECERIRAGIRRTRGKQTVTSFEIRLMVYDDEKSNFIKPRLQKRPYQNAAGKLAEWHRKQKENHEQSTSRTNTHSNTH